MLVVVIIAQTRTGGICPHPLKTSPYKVNCKTCSTLTWAITIWPMVTLRYTTIAIMLSTTTPGLHKRRLPHQPPYVLISISHIHLSNQTFRRRKLIYLTAQIRMPRLVPLEPSPMDGLPRALSPIGQPMKSSDSLRSSIYVSPIQRLRGFIWNLAMTMESGWSLPSNWLTFEVATCTWALPSPNNESF